MAWFAAHLLELQQQGSQPQPADGEQTTGLFQEIGIPCNECGQYFPSFRIMRAHKARKHGYRGQNKRKHAAVLTAAEYAAGSVAGMPQCAKCHKVFTRVEGLKHLRSGCDGGVAGRAHCEEDVTASVGQVPAERVELPRCRAPQTVLRALPVADRPVDAVVAHSAAFCAHVNVDWRRVAARTEYRQVLKEHCVLCGQWSSRVKQHLRQMHPECWRFRAEATSMCRSAGLAATAPCSYCDFPLRQPGRHLTSCPVVFQVALMRLLLQPGGPLHSPEDGGGDGCGRAAGSTGAPGAGGCVRGVEEDGGASHGAGRSGTRVSGGGGTAAKVEEGRKQRQGTLDFFLGRMGQRQPRKASMEGGHSCGDRREQADPGATEVSGENVGEARAGADAHQAGRGLHRFLRHVGAGMRRHAAGGAQDVAAAVSAGAGEDCPEDYPRHGNDEGPAGEGGGGAPGQRCTMLAGRWRRTRRWTLRGSIRRGTPRRKQVRSEAAPIKHSEALRLVDLLLANLPREGVLTRFSCLKLQLEKFDVEVIPVTLQLSLRGEASDACHKALKTLSGCAFMKRVRWRPERIQKPPLANALEEAYLNMPYCDWSRREYQTPWPRKST